MSTTLSTTDLVNEVMERARFGIGSNFAMARVNQAFRKITQSGPYDWEQARTTLSVTTTATTVALPSDIDIGKPKVLGGPTGNLAVIPYVDAGEFFNQNQFYSTGTAASASPGMYSAWTYVRNNTAAANGTATCVLSNATITYASGTAFAATWIGQTIVINSVAYTITAFPSSTTLTISPVFASANAVYSFQTSAFYAFLAYLAPGSAAPSGTTFSLPFIYHVKPAVLTMSTAQFFPSPDEFDDIIIQLAEAEAKRIYGIAGWQDVMSIGMQALAPLTDQYKSTNLNLGLGVQAAQSQEAQAKRAE